MTPKDFLRQYRDANDNIDARLTEISNLRELAMKTTSNISSEPVQGGASDKIGTIVSKIADMEKEVDTEVNNLQKAKQEVNSVIESVKCPKLRKILYQRYICGYKWEQIAVNLDYDYRHVTRLHGEALEKVKEIIESR